VPNELYRGRYQEADMTYGNPYTMFNRRKDNWSLITDLNLIRNNIINGVDINDDVANNEYSIFYKDIYIYDTTTNEPNNCSYDKQCDHPVWVKNNALVYLIGLRYARINGKDTFMQLTEADKEWFAWRAKEGLSNLNPRIISCYGGADCGKVTPKAFDLIQYLQAYDMLKTGGYLPPFDQDRSPNDCSPRNKLREFARNMYVESEDVINSFYGWKKNHGIICASALGMAAIVLNDAGVETSYAYELKSIKI
jgi:hypothetical protein